MGTVELGGPEQFHFDELIRRDLQARGDTREVIADPHARYFGTELEERSLVRTTGLGWARSGYAEWFARATGQAG